MTSRDFSQPQWLLRSGLLMVLSVFAGFAAVSNQSLWIDEANSAMIACQPTWDSFVASLSGNRGSDLQMPGYMTALWAWEKVAGPSEWGLRSLNILFFIFAQIAILFLFRAPIRVRTFTAVAAILYPFSWFYLDEARPYLMQYVGGMVTAVACINALVFPDRTRFGGDVVIFCAGLIILCASSLIGVLLSGAFFLCFLVAVFLNRRNHQKGGSLGIPGLLTIGITVLTLAGLAAYYLWTLSVGARASGIGKTGVESLAFAVYEIFGIAGLGPDRSSLRSGGIAALRPFAVTLALGAVWMSVTGLLAIFCIRDSQAYRRRWFWIMLLCVGAMSALLAAGGFLAGFRVLGRHFTPFVGLFLIGFGAILAWLASKPRLQWLPVVLLLPWIISVWGIRYSGQFQKDDYRASAEVASKAIGEGMTVWWAADEAGAKYYFGNAFSDRIASGQLTILMNPLKADLDRLKPPSMIVLSKPDIYDANGSLRSYASERSLTLTKRVAAFDILQAASSSLPMND